MSSRSPPRKTIGPLDYALDGGLNPQCEAISHMKAIPFPLAPLQAIKQHESGVVVMTNPPSALLNESFCQGIGGLK